MNMCFRISTPRRLVRSGAIAAVMLAASFARTTVAQSSQSRGGTSSSPGGTSEVVVTGCVQKARGNPQTGAVSPSGYVLMNASNASHDEDSVATNHGVPHTSGTNSGGAAVPPGLPGNGGSGGVGSGSGRSADDGVRSPGAGALSNGITYLLDGSGIAAHAGEHVEIHGRLARIGNRSGGGRSAGSPGDLPQVLVATSVRTLARDCRQ
jgi:hypothetical protein